LPVTEIDAELGEMLGPDEDEHARAIAAQLAEREFAFDFLVQPRTSAELSVECSTIEWTEAQAPFHKVATIRSLREHRPLGSVNRVRRVVYEEISRARHQMNGVPPREPTPGETFEI